MIIQYKKIICFLAVLSFGILLIPSFSLANSANSENYQVIDQGDFGGNVSNSENYQIFGFLTDMGQIVFWPQIVSADDGGGGDTGGESQEGIPITIGAEAEAEKIAPISSGGFELFGKLTGTGLRNTTLGAIAKGLNVPLATTGLVLTLAIALMSQLFGGVAILSLFSNFWAWLLSIFGFGKKKENYGMVYDAEAKEPIARAVVQIFESEYNKLLSTQMTDNEGRFLMVVDPGNYYIKVIKSNYKFPSASVSEGYHGASFTVKQKQELLYQIPMDPDHKVLASRINLLSGLVKFFNVIRIPVIILGTILSAVALYQDMTIVNLVVACLYIVIWMVEIYKLRKTKPYGITKDREENKLIDRVIVRLFSEKNKLVSTQVSDTRGRYSFLANPGNYKITAIKTSYEQYEKPSLEFKKSGRVNVDLLMEKKKPKIKIVPTVYESKSTNNVGDRVDDNMHPSWV